MAVKVVSVSDDSGASWFDLPGDGFDYNHDADSITDTILGQTYASAFSGLITWGVGGNVIFKGVAGYNCSIKKTGTTTAYTDEPMSLVSGKTYKVTNAAKNVFDRAVALVFEDNGVVVDAEDIESVDYLYGRVTFVSGYTVTGPVTVASGSYLPLASVGKFKELSLTQTAEANDDTYYQIAQSNGGYKVHNYGLRTVSLEASGIYDSASDFDSLIQARQELILEIRPANDELTIARGYFRAMTNNNSGDVGATEAESVNFELNVPYDSTGGAAIVPFKWLIDTTSTIPSAVRKCIDAWQNTTDLLVRYSPNGVGGAGEKEGNAIVTEVSFASSIDGTNDYSVTFMGDGAITV